MPQVGTVESYETPLGFHRFACDFGAWAERSHDEASEHYSPVPYYLYCRSIELFLKAFLLAKGLSKQQVAKLGHNLVALLVEARTQGLHSLVDVEPTWEKELARAGEQYTNKDFEYFTVRFHLDHKPALMTLRQLSRALQAGVKQVCVEAADGPPLPHVAAANAAFESKRRSRKGAA
jgi:hypothetical protein